MRARRHKKTVLHALLRYGSCRQIPDVEAKAKVSRGKIFDATAQIVRKACANPSLRTEIAEVSPAETARQEWFDPRLRGAEFIQNSDLVYVDVRVPDRREIAAEWRHIVLNNGGGLAIPHELSLEVVP